MGALNEIANIRDLEKYVILEKPSLEEAAEFVRRNWRHCVILIFAFCSVNYRGRAASQLSPSDHFIITKPDGTLMVHGPEKREPINWNPPGAIVTSYVEGDKLVIRSRRHYPKEIVVINCYDVYLILGMSTKSGKFELFMSESQMVDYVWKNPSIIEDGFTPISREYRIRFGVVDLYGYDKDGNILICEFKRRVADIQDVGQLALYVESVQKTTGRNVRGILVAPGVSETALLALKEKGLEFRKLDPKDILGGNKE
ncbi:MAG: endonuclease NucS [Candidatus Korarchaeota archaeon]|nr:endonuclease NucS [Thermoproteota archaeon]MCR8455275.1 endonuclease NucS [Thermoproteota archaeon]MCR8463041.1 endonuclease NucS [Thermoproteota archaeon]MCR8470619.1 endonuclease NucS [Thermoproteota archaeon]MCR8471587.1 endonuclease NucS [Thermoproteota archaeon]